MTTAGSSFEKLVFGQLSRILLLAVLSLVMFSPATWAADQFALVIGNSEYGKRPLRNPNNDADIMSAALRDLGFDVTTHKNVDIDQFDAAIREFGSKLTPGSVAFFYFAGHGLQIDGVNYLVPVNHGIKERYEVERKCVKLDALVSMMKESASNMNVLVLDACRDNPFDRSWSRGLQSQGLASIEAPEGTVIAFSTDKGRVALDGDGENSPYTASLVGVLNTLPEDGLEIVDVFRQASRKVYQMTRQRPFLDFSAYSERFYLLPVGATARLDTPPEMPAESDAAQVAVESLPESDSVDPTPPKQAKEDHRLKQARIFANEREFELAIEAFSSVIEDPELPLSLRNQARRGRGGAYLSRLEGDDIKRAIIDYQAAGEKGIRLSVRADEALLKTQAEIRGKVLKSQVVYITQANGKWLWVASVQDDTNRSGWIDRAALLRTPAVPASTSASTQGSQGTSTDRSTGGVSETIIYDQYGRPINQPQTESSQVILYDQYGRPSSPSGSSRIQTQSSPRSIQPSNSGNRRRILSRPPPSPIRRIRPRIGR